MQRVRIYQIVCAVTIIYPWGYDIVQMKEAGVRDYFSSAQNLFDFVFIYSGVANIILILFEDDARHLSVAPAPRIMMLLTILCSIPKTFFLLRVFESLSYIVTMLANVIYDLRVFLLFYGILIFMFAQFITILGVPNYGEYDKIGLFLGNLLQTLRISMGDFNFDNTEDLSIEINFLWWLVWLLIVVVTNIIFLNFIIAEASASYETVKERLDEFILKERTDLINESEDMTPDFVKSEYTFPKYIITRTIDN